MGNDSDHRPKMGQSNGYETVGTIDAIAAAARHITSTYTEQIAVVAITLRLEGEINGDVRNVSRRKASGSRQLYTQSEYEITPPTEWRSGEQVVHHLLDKLRPLVRKTDRVFLLGHTVYFLLAGADQQGGQIVQTRLWEALLWHINNITHAQSRSPVSTCTITIGHSAHPGPSNNIDQLLKAAAETALRFDQQAKKRKVRSVAEAGYKAPLAVQHINLFEDENVDEELPALARKLGIPYLTLLPSKLPAGIRQLVNPKLAQELQCYPLGRERNMLTVAMINPQDNSALDRLHQETGLNIFPVLTHPQALQTALEQLVC
jgi:hypothetical protein